jgi:ABC-type transport system involved in cytochrome bd biosynthesis fused ATPase/permease subunit
MKQSPLLGLREIIALLGLATLGTGLAFIDWRAALIVVGSLLFAVAVVPLLVVPRKEP